MNAPKVAHKWRNNESHSCGFLKSSSDYLDEIRQKKKKKKVYRYVHT